MTLKKNFPIFLHLIICLIILALPLLVMGLGHEALNTHFYYSYLIRTGFLLILFYFNYLYLIDRFLFHRKFVVYILINLLMIVAFVLLQEGLIDLLQFNDFKKDQDIHLGGGQQGEPKHPLPLLFFRLVGDYTFPLFFVGSSVAFRVTRRWYSDSLNFESLKAANLEADLKQLKEQLNPHFLFNTLNNIYFLIGTDTMKAQESVHRLSALLRYALYDNESQIVELGKEIDFTKDFIALMALRLPKEFNLTTHIQNEAKHLMIAPMLFVTLIENAFKHGIKNPKTDFVSVKIVTNDKGSVLCVVANSFHKPANAIKDAHAGIGLKNLKQRLELIYPNKYKLDIKETNGIFEVILSINLIKDKTNNDFNFDNSN